MKNIAIGITIFLLLWALILIFGIIDTFFLPTPLQVLTSLKNLFVSGKLIQDTAMTLARVGASLLIALGVGVPTGLLLGRFEKMYHSVEFIIDFFRSTPATALFPLFLVVFGIGEISKVALASFAATLIVIFNTAYGVMHAPKYRRVTAELLGATHRQIFWHVIIRESLPQLLVGIRNAVSWVLAVVVVTEMFIGTNTGLGRRIIDSSITYDISGMYASILVVGLIGYLLNALLLLIHKRYVHW
ncbi:ABC transporter permease [Patescibacteria group bacterium]|nr:MAG: ABC transporter permease [Patescibacteria group bacterium]